MEIAIIVKLARVLMLAPLAIIIGIYDNKHNKSAGTEKKKVPFPYFMLGFIATSIIGTLLIKYGNTEFRNGIIPKIEIPAFIILGMAMAALGFSVNFKVLFTRGKKLLGAATLASVVLYGLAFVAAYFFF